MMVNLNGDAATPSHISSSIGLLPTKPIIRILTMAVSI